MEILSVDQIQSGEKRPFGDVEYEYKIKSSLGPEKVLHFCTIWLHKCKYSSMSHDREFYHPYYQFSRKGDDEYWYKVTSPYLD